MYFCTRLVNRDCKQTSVTEELKTSSTTSQVKEGPSECATDASQLNYTRNLRDDDLDLSTLLLSPDKTSCSSWVAAAIYPCETLIYYPLGLSSPWRVVETCRWCPPINLLFLCPCGYVLGWASHLGGTNFFANIRSKLTVHTRDTLAQCCLTAECLDETLQPADDISAEL